MYRRNTFNSPGASPIALQLRELDRAPSEIVQDPPCSSKASSRVDDVEGDNDGGGNEGENDGDDLRCAGLEALVEDLFPEIA